MDAVRFFKEKMRMCASFGGDSCTGCPIHIMQGLLRCPQFCEKYPERAVDIVETWAKKHPQETRLTQFLKHYPHAPLNKNDGIPNFCLTYLGLENPSYGECKDKTCADCWNTPLEEE